MNLEAFYRENYPILFGYLLSLCGDTHLAEDLTSETFLRAILKIGSYDGSVKASTWLCAIGKNLYRNEMKKRRRYVPLEEAPLRGGSDPEAACLRAQRSRDIRALIEALGEPASHVVRMRQQGLSFREIADALGKNESWARVTFFRAKEKLIKGLEELE